MIPGEQLLSKMWETICDKGIGGLLRPWQTRREGRAAIELRREEMLVLAQTERDAEAIRRGEITLTFAKEESFALPGPSIQQESAPPSVALLEAEEIAARNAKADAIRKEVATARAVLQAEEELAGDPSPAPGASINDDWLHKWREGVAGVASEDLQRIWGKVLAGEVKAPGKYSLRTLDFIRNLSQDDAKLIQKVAPFVIGGAIYRPTRQLDKWLEDYGISYAELLDLQDMGVLSSVDSITLSVQIGSIETTRFFAVLLCHGAALMIKSADPTKRLDLSACSVTNVGKQVMTLGASQPNLDMLRALGNTIKSHGFEVDIGTYIEIGGGKCQLSGGATPL